MLKYWNDAIIPGGFEDAAVARLMQSPGLSDSMRHSILGALSLFDNDQVLHRNVKDLGRFVLGVLVLYLDGTGGVTHRRLRELSGGAGIVSSGRATAILWQLRRIGYVTAESDRAGGQNHRYVPTAEMRAAFNARFRNEFEALTHAIPQMQTLVDRLDEPDINRAIWSEIGRHALSAVSQPFHGEFPITRYSERNAGMLILYALLAEVPRSGVFPSPGIISLSISALSKRFEVSRTHVRRLLGELTEAGYYLPHDDGTGSITETLCHDLRRYYVYSYIGLGACAYVVLRNSDALIAEAAQ